MFLKDVPKRLDLQGRRPKANRPTIIGMAALLIIVALLTIASLKIAHDTNGPQFKEVFRSSLQLRDRLADIPVEIEFMRFVSRVEDSLRIISDSVLALYKRPLLPSTRDSLRIDLSTIYDSGRGLASDDDILRFFQGGPDAPSYPSRFLGDGIDSARVALVPQVSIRPEWDRLLENLEDTLKFRDTLLLRLERIGELFSERFDSFPNLTLGARPDSLLHRQLESSQSKNVVRNAHLYAALFLPRGHFHPTDVAPLESTRAEELLEHRVYVKYAPERSAGSLLRERLAETDPDSIRTFDTIGTAFVLYPASPTERTYDPAQRPWFRSAMVSGDVEWSLSYPDVGTDLPVVTASLAVRENGESEPIGVIGIDFFTNQLCALPTLGYQFLTNLAVQWLLTAFLVAVVVISSRQRFDPLLWVFGSLVIYYTWLSLQWVYEDRILIPLEFKIYLDLLLSIISTMLILAAALGVFRDFEHDPRNPGRSRRKSRDSSKALVNLMRKFTEERPSLLTTILGALIVAFATAGFDIVLSPFYKTESGVFFTWVDVFTSSIAIAVFGYYLSKWMDPYFQSWFVNLTLAVFIVYSISQVPYPFLQNESWYWQLLAAARSIALALVVGAVFGWIQHDNYERLRSAGSRSLIIQRVGTPRNFVTIAGIIDTDEIIFVDRSTLQLLAWLPFGPDVGGAEEYKVNEPLEDWRVSRFGDDLYQSTSGRHVSELFLPGQFQEIVKMLNRAKVKVKIRKTLGDHQTRRVTSIKLLDAGATNSPCFMICKDGVSLPTSIVTITAWQDWDGGAADAVDESEGNWSPWYFVYLARAGEA